MKISVIIPTYNRRAMVVRAVESVLTQSIPPQEIIVIDDGSTDGTSWEDFPNGVIYKTIPHNGHPGYVRNIGVELATSDYIAFLDSDDIWLPNKLEEQINYFNNHPKTNVLHTLERWEMNGKFVSQKKRKHKREGDIFRDSLQGCIIGPSTVVIKKEIFNKLGGFNNYIEVGEDYDLWLRLSNSYRVDYIDKELIVKNAGHGDQLSFKYGYIEPFKIDVLETLILSGEFTRDNTLLATDALLSKYKIIINGCLKRGKREEADSYLKREESFLIKIKDRF